ncbi:aldose epimerase family protein [Lacticaseibacillus manihotivorans]|nr:aldose epimerase family protein [Lacticaseibacillus manihotivorans]QFQ92837.1 galactose mutarotase [Lacticaseibacillus manihotivorans]
MTVTMTRYGTKNGEQEYEYTMTNHNGLQALVLNYGATLEKILTPAGDNLILSLDSPKAYDQERNFLGGTVGRVVGRLPGHVWRFGDQEIVLPKGEGENAIHGGAEGLDTQVFTGSYREFADYDEVYFTFLDPAGHNDFPGNVRVTVTYRLDDEDKLTYHVDATTDAPTLFNPTNHVYFALDGEGSTVDDTTLTLACDFYAPLTDHLPIDGWAPVADTPFDFTQGQRLGDVMPQVLDGAGFDHPFLNKSAQAATLVGESGRKMHLTTTAPGIVIYTANHFDHTGVAHNIGQHAGVALEAQIPPASGLDWSAITLLPGQPYRLTTSWQFEF